MPNILAIPGSLRENSSSNQILKALIDLAPSGITITTFNGLRSLPHFDDSQTVPQEVTSFRSMIKNADAVLICTPEYAFGIPGSLKNALDWTVGSGEFVDKPVSLITASSSGDKGHAALLLVLQAISAKVIEDATLLISFVRAKIGSDGTIKDPSLEEQLQKTINSLASRI